MTDETTAPATPALAEHVEAVAAAAEAELAQLAQDAAADASTKTAAVNAAVDAWVVERVHNSPISRDTEIWNYFASTVDDLKARIAQKR